MTNTLEKDILEPEEITLGPSQDLGREEQQRACPECGKVLTLRGLHGHLRLAHKKTPKEIGSLAKRSKIAPLSKMEAVFALLDQLEEINERLEQVDKLQIAGQFNDEETYVEFWDALCGQHKEIVESLKNYGITYKTGVDI